MKKYKELILIAFAMFCISSSCKKENVPIKSEEILEYKIFSEAQPSDISFLNEDIGFISSSVEPSIGSATIAKTIDGGKHWETIPVSVDNSPTTVLRTIY